MKIVISKVMATILAAVMGVSALPATQAVASNPTLPASGPIVNAKLELAWAREMKAYEFLGKVFNDTDAHVAKIQERIDKAASNGKDVSDLQSALDAYAAALSTSKPIYDDLGTIITAHSGFDADGHVTDADLARTTVQDVRTKLQDLKSSMNGTFKALREAMKAFRDANKPTPTPEK